MHPAIAATLAVVLFWLVAGGIGLLLPDSTLDRATGVIASVVVGAIVYRAVRRSGM